MRPVRYNVAATLDGFIATADGGFDWIPEDPAVDFAAIFASIDTVLIGRRSYEAAQKMGMTLWSPTTRVYLFSSTLTQADHPNVTLVRTDAGAAVEALRRETGDGEIWLFGGGALFQSLLAARQVDRIEVTIVPVLLGGGIPLLSPGAPLTRLQLLDTHRYPSGMVTLAYEVPDRVHSRPQGN